MKVFTSGPGSKITILTVAMLLPILWFPNISYAQEEPPKDVGITDHLGEYLDLDTQFQDEDGKTVTIRELTDGKPFILTLVYYRCPGICSPLLTEVAGAVEKMDLKPGEDYKIITISFDPTETPETAKKKKANYIDTMKNEFPPDAWCFLTGKEENIRKITDGVGFGYKEFKGEYIHAGAIMAISPDGKIARYLYGLRYLPFDVKMALIEAGEGRVGPTIAKYLQYCFSYDPAGKRYAFNFLRVAGTATSLVGLAFLVFLLATTKKYRDMIKREANANE